MKRGEELDFDMNDLKNSLSSANSAMKVATIAEDMERKQRIIAEANRQSAQRNAVLMAGAQASIEQKNLLEQQLEIIHEQNRLLKDNYEKLKEMYDAQVQVNKDAAKELARSKRYNAGMMIISLIAMFAAVASPIITLWIS